MKGKAISFRPSTEMRARLDRLCAATERPLTYYLQKAIEAHIDALEQKYAEELKELTAKQIEYKITTEQAIAAERSPKKKTR